jgi:hypothetical protein
VCSFLRKLYYAILIKSFAPKASPFWGEVACLPQATVYPHLFLIIHYTLDNRKNNRTLIYTGLADEKRIYIPIPSARDGMDLKKVK